MFTTFDHSDPESDDEIATGVHVAAGHSDWIKPGSHHKFPCPLQNHDHEIAACPEFLTLTPKDCWFKIPKGRICYTCLKPKGANGVCKTRRCTEEKTIPQVLLCAACTPWAAAKGWASFSILMCRKQEHGKDRPKPAEARKFLEKYLGKINTAIADNNLSYAVNFNYQVFSVSDIPIPTSTSTPTFDSELGIEVDTATVTVIPEVPEHSFYLMQWLRIGGSNQLIFFDRGANAHLVQGKMAVAAGFEITSSRPMSLTVAGGGNLKTEYGSYQFSLGPGAGGEYHEIEVNITFSANHLFLIPITR